MLRGHYKRFVICVLVILSWLGFVVEGSHALFSDTATLAGNSILTGTTDLQVSNSQNGSSTLFADSRPGFSFDLSPGQSEDKYFFLKNTGSANVPMSIDVRTVPQGTVNNLFSEVVAEFTPVNSEGVSNGSTVSLNLGAGIVHPVDLGVTINGGETRRFKLRTSILSSYTEQNQSISYDLFFTGLQNIGG